MISVDYLSLHNLPLSLPVTVPLLLLQLLNLPPDLHWDAQEVIRHLHRMDRRGENVKLDCKNT